MIRGICGCGCGDPSGASSPGSGAFSSISSSFPGRSSPASVAGLLAAALVSTDCGDFSVVVVIVLLLSGASVVVVISIGISLETTSPGDDDDNDTSVEASLPAVVVVVVVIVASDVVDVKVVVSCPSIQEAIRLQ